MSQPAVIALSGRPGSGKSTLARALADALCWPCVSSGNYVRQVAAHQGLPDTRENLQQLGESIIENEGIATFGQLVLTAGGWSPGQPVVIEGVRHVSFLAALRALVVPLRLWHVHVQAGELVRHARLRARGTGEIDRLETIEGHSTEADVPGKLRGLADLIIDADRPLESLIRIVVAALP